MDPLISKIIAALSFCFLLTHAAYAKSSDPHSFANFNDVIVRHISLDLEVSFDQKKIKGVAGLQIENLSGANKIILDTNALVIKNVRVGSSASDLRDSFFALQPPNELLGRALLIVLKAGDRYVEVTYQTSDDAIGITWNDAKPEIQERESMYTLSTSIWARTWYPCQDSPAVRFTFSARVHVPPGMLALMSAVNPQATRPDGVYTFQMDRPIPSYLVALAVGNYEYRAIGPTTGIYAPAHLLDEMMPDFLRMEEVKTVGENRMSAYDWGRYDVLIMSRSWPYGAMENPMLTFMGQMYRGDGLGTLRVIAHEFSHSYTGNRTSGENWANLSLTEGTTTWTEQLMFEDLEGKELADLGRSLKYIALLRAYREDDPARTIQELLPDLRGENPDANLSVYSYDKAYLFLATIEQIIGQDEMLRFMRAYLDRYKFQSVSWWEVLGVLKEQHPEIEQHVNFRVWLKEAPLPAQHFVPRSTLLEQLQASTDCWLNGQAAFPEVDCHNTDIVRAVLDRVRELPAGRVRADQLQKLDQQLQLSTHPSGNLRRQWYVLSIKQRYDVGMVQAAKDAAEWPAMMKMILQSYYNFLPKPQSLTLARDLLDRARPFANPASMALCEGQLQDLRQEYTKANSPREP